MRRALPSVSRQTEFIAFEGGADFVTPSLLQKPGFVREAQNFEIDVNGGYTRIKGYERFDGQTKPSDAQYAILPITTTGSITAGDTVSDNAGTGSGLAVAVTSTYLVLTGVAGTFAVGNLRNVTLGSIVVGTVTGPQVVDGASTPLLHATYKVLAAAAYRAAITAVPGSGSILGVWMFNDVVYAFRNNAGGTAAAMYKSTTSGWSAVALGRELSFTSGGVTEITEGQTITGATSGATAVVTRVVLESGSWAAGTAAGRFIFASQTGTFQSENIDVGASLNLATIAGNSSAITFAVPSGRFEFVNHNFGGAVNTKRMYGCDGKNRAFEFDGTVFVPISTGMTSDAPEHITVHKNQLFLSFIASVQHSAPGEPYVFSAVLGAAEIAMGDQVTGFKLQAGGEGSAALFIATRNGSAVLYGSDSSDWNLVPFSNEAGAYAHTIQHLGFTLMLDDRGLTSLSATQAFGNFATATLSKRVQTWLNTKRSLATASCVMRDKSQYRLFFSDGSALFVTLDNGKVLGMMPQLFDDEVRCCCSLEMNDGSEAAFFGSDDGFVYQMERGPNFDGDNIEAYLHFVFNASGNHRQQKRYRACTLEVSGEGYAEIEFSYELGYSASTIEQPGTQTLTSELTSSNWDTGNWDTLFWDGRALLPSEADMVGTAENAAIRLRSNSPYFEPMRFSGATITYSPRRQLRANN